MQFSPLSDAFGHVFSSSQNPFTRRTAREKNAHVRFNFSEWLILSPEDSWARRDRTWICWCAVSNMSFQRISVILHASITHELSDTISNPLTSSLPYTMSSRAEDMISTPGPFRQEFNIFQLNQSRMVIAQCNLIPFHHKCPSCEAIHRPDKLVEIKMLKNMALIDCLGCLRGACHAPFCRYTFSFLQP